MPLVLGVDSSTSACKVQVRDTETGAVVASGRALHPPTTPPCSEQQPRDWEVAFDAACAEAGVPTTYRPEALAVAAQQHGLVVLGEQDQVLRPAKLWNDTQSAPDTEDLLAQLAGGPAAWAAACGSVLVPSFTVTKLRWLRRCEPEVLRRTATVMLPHDWLTFRLTGRRVTDRGDASGTGYWSPAESRYRYDLLHELIDGEVDWERALPEVLPPEGVAGDWAMTGAQVGPGTGDNMAAALGLGLRPGDLALSLGTSGTAFTVSDQPSADPSGTVAGFADATGRYLPLVCTMNATKVTDAVARLLGVDHERFDELALEAPAGASGLVLVPHLDGERTPNRPGATGTLAGLRSDVTPAQLARAAVEGVVCNLLHAAEPLGRVTDGRVFLIGGAARSPAYRRVVADLTGRAVQVPSEEELVAAGAAVQAAAVHLGCGFAQISDAWGLGQGDVVEPDDAVDRVGILEAYAVAAGADAT